MFFNIFVIISVLEKVRRYRFLLSGNIFRNVLRKYLYMTHKPVKYLYFHLRWHIVSIHKGPLHSDEISFIITNLTKPELRFISVLTVVDHLCKLSQYLNYSVHFRLSSCIELDYLYTEKKINFVYWTGITCCNYF